MLRTLAAQIETVQLLAPVVVSASATVSTGVNLTDVGSVMFQIAVGAFSTFDGSNKLAIVMQHSDTDVDGDYANCADADILDAEDGANGVLKLLDASGDAGQVYEGHYLGYKKFARIRLVETGTVSVPVAVLAVKGHLEARP